MVGKAIYSQLLPFVCILGKKKNNEAFFLVCCDPALSDISPRRSNGFKLRRDDSNTQRHK